MSIALDRCIQESFEQEVFDDVAIDTINEAYDDFLLIHEQNVLESSIRYKLFQEGLD